MNATKIQGKYLCVGDLGGSYTLTGADRDATMLLTAHDPISLLAVNNKGARSVFLCGNTRTRITRARLRSPAGPGVNSANPIAGAVVLSFCAMVGLNQDAELDAVKLAIPTWGDWFDVNLDIEPYKTAYSWSDAQILQGRPVGCFVGDNSSLKVDDYNIQNDYVGEAIGAVLDIEFETAGVLDSQYYTIM